MTAPVEVCCIYASADEPLRQTLEKHVSAMKRQGLISLWHDQQITLGQDRIEAMDAHMNSASVILLLVSPDFLASDDCYEVALQRAMERHDHHEAKVIPVLVRPVDYQGASFAQLMALPTGGRAVTQWNNQDEAWLDVSSGLRRVIATPAPKRPSGAQIWNIPFRRNPYFTGREEILTKLERAFQPTSRAVFSQPQAITGLGGIGKTQIALEYAYQHRDDYQAVLWCRAETREDLISGYLVLAELLQLAVREEKEQLMVVQAVIAWLETHEHWLFILDNADELPLVQAFLPPVTKGSVLLTTRAASMGRLAQCLEVQTLTPDIGAIFLLRRAGRLALDASLEQADPRSVQLAREMVQEMGGLPLALDQAGAYIEEVECSLAEYLFLHRSKRTTLLKERGGIVQDHPAAVAATWSLSFAKVEQTSPVAADLLRLCAFLQPDAIPEEIMVQGASHLDTHLQVFSNDPLAFNSAIKVLRSYSLVRRDPNGHLLSIHPLVQAVLKDTMNVVIYRQWAERAVEAVNGILPDEVEYRTWKWYERCLPHALGLVSLIDEIPLTSPTTARLLNQVGIYLFEHARFQAAEPLYEKALHIWERFLGPTHPNVTNPLCNLANLYSELGKYTDAERLYERVLSIREQLLGVMHPDVTYPLNNLANLYKKQGRYSEAQQLYERTLSIRERSLGVTHPDVTYPLNGLAILYRVQGKYREAEQLYQRARAILEHHLGQEHPDVAYPLNNLANLYKEQGRYSEAECLYERALLIREQSLGMTHPDVAYPLNNLANLYKEQGRYSEAECLYERALSIREQSLGMTHPDVAYPLHGLALLYKEQGKYTEAEQLYQRALAILEHHWGRTHPNTQETRKSYAALLHLVGRSADAIALDTDHK